MKKNWEQLLEAEGMNAEERLKFIELRIKKIRDIVIHQKKEISLLYNENKQLKEELEQLKKSNFELNKQIEIANMANHLSSEGDQSKELKKRLDKYIREVDSVINALKHQE